MLVTNGLLLSLGVATSLFTLAALLRLYAILPSRRSRPDDRPAGLPTRVLIVLGSGGHTAELLNMLSNLPTSRYSHRTYVVSSGDNFSEQKAVAFEETLAGLAELRRRPYGSYDISRVPRARRVHQSLLTTPYSVLRCFFACVRMLSTAPEHYKKQIASLEREVRSRQPRMTRAVPGGRQAHMRYSPFPALILTNGPATGLVVVAASIWLRFFGFAPSGETLLRTIFIESWARVSSLSLTGKILVATGMCERTLVQWEPLSERYGGAERMDAQPPGQVEFIGPLVR